MTDENRMKEAVDNWWRKWGSTGIADGKTRADAFRDGYREGWQAALASQPDTGGCTACVTCGRPVEVAEPVAWRVRYVGNIENVSPDERQQYVTSAEELRSYLEYPADYEATPLYTSPQPSIPAIYKMVPKWPSEAMILSGQRHAESDPKQYTAPGLAVSIYLDMLAAAPTPGAQS